MAAEVIPENITLTEQFDDTVEATSKLPAEHISTYVLPRLVESDLGVSRHRPAGEPGSLQGIDFHNVDERPDDNQFEQTYVSLEQLTATILYFGPNGGSN